MEQCPICQTKVSLSLIEIHTSQCLDAPGTGVTDADIAQKKQYRPSTDANRQKKNNNDSWQVVAHSKVAQAKVKEAARVDSRPAHLREKTKQHSGALQKIIVEAEVDKQPLRAEQEREREESTKKNPSYSFGISDDIMLLILAFLDARSLSRAGRVCTHWRMLANQNTVWRERYLKDFVGSDKSKQAQRLTKPGTHMNWKEAYLLNVSQQPLLQVALQSPANPYAVLSGNP